MDPEIEEIKEKLNKVLALSEDTNRVMRSMRRSQRWARFFSIAWWLFILGASGAAYYYFFQPYLMQVMSMYQSLSGGSSGGGFEQQFADYIKQYLGQ